MWFLTQIYNNWCIDFIRLHGWIHTAKRVLSSPYLRRCPSELRRPKVRKPTKRCPLLQPDVLLLEVSHGTRAVVMSICKCMQIPREPRWTDGPLSNIPGNE